MTPVALDPPAQYAHVPYPWSAEVQRDAVAPARFYTAVIGQALRYGAPASRTPGPLWALAGRTGFPETPLAALLRRLPGRPRPQLDEFVAAARDGWPELAARSRSLPATPPKMSVLALQRAAALTVFLFGKETNPLVVLKVPAPGDRRVDLEADSLREVEAAGAAPRYLGRLGEARVQEGLAGAPLRVEPLTPRSASTFAWSPTLDDVADGIGRLGAATVKSGAPDDIARRMDMSVAYEGLDSQTRRVLSAAWADVRSSRASVLRHRDTSPQNCLVADGRLSGVVDWELAVPRGGPGFDVWNLALSYMEFGVGLTRWSQDLLAETFERSWRDSPFWRDGRAAARRAAVAAGAAEGDLDALEVCFFGSRIGDRLLRPGWQATGPDTVARALRVVCSS